MAVKQFLKWTLFTVISASALLLHFFSAPSSLSKFFKDFSYDAELIKDMKISEKRDFSDNNLNINVIKAESKNSILRLTLIDGISVKRAHDFLEDQKYTVKSSFRSQKVPYPGALTMIQQCPEELMPITEHIENTGMIKAGFFMYTNDRLVFGGFDSATIKYSMMLALIYHEDKSKMLKIEYYFPRESQEHNKARRIFESLSTKSE